MIEIGAGIPNDNLVFGFDLDAVQTYNGPIVQNVAVEITPQGVGNNTYYKFSSGEERVYIPTLGPMNSKYMDMWNDYPNSGNCCPNPFRYGWSLPVTPSTEYTYAIVYKSVNRYNHPNYMYHYEYNSTNQLLIEYGVHKVGGYGGVETELGDGWYWSRAKFTTQPTAATINPGSWMYQYNTHNRLYIAKVLIAKGDWMNMHPSKWPDVGTTTTATNTITDMTGRTVLTHYNPVYNNDGKFTFNGSAHFRCDAPVGLPTTSNGTVIAWIKPSSSIPTTTSYTGIVSYGGRGSTTPSDSRLLSIYNTGSVMYLSSAYWSNDYVPNNLTLIPNQWNMVVMISRAQATTNNTTFYVGNSNGLATSTGSSSSANRTINSPSIRLGIGTTDYPGRLYQGEINSVLIYDRELTADEIRRVYSAGRGRYGI